MNTTTIIILVAVVWLVVLAIAAVGIWLILKKQRTKDLRAKFGPEYNRMVRAQGDAKHAEHVLQERQKRVEKLNIRPLSGQEQEEFAEAWEREQSRFIDDPATAVDNADHLVRQVMKTRGYPVSEFEQRVADVSVDHPAVVQNYRIAHNIAVRSHDEDVTLRKLREAMLHYRALFADLLHDGGVQPIRQVRPDEQKRHAA
jgi:hypothetical protein